MLARRRHLRRLSRHEKHRRLIVWLVVLLLVSAVGFVIQTESLVDSRLNAKIPVPGSEDASNTPHGGRVLSYQHLASVQLPAVDTAAKAVYGEANTIMAKYAVEQYAITYSSVDARSGQAITVGGRLYLPVGTKNAPSFVFGPGTTGPGPSCAPSLERARGKNWGHYDDQLSFYAGQGYAVATTDYDGRQGNNSIHHYFVGEMEGRVMLDAARAMLSFADPDYFAQSPAANGVFFSGYSQGGHAALWADQLRSKYAPDVKVAGIVGFATASDLERTFRDLSRGSSAIWLPAYLYAAYKDYYGLTTPATAIFKDPYAQTVETDARQFCIDQVEIKQGRYGSGSNVPNVFQPQFLSSLADNSFDIKYPDLSKYMWDNLAGSYATSTPVLLMNGDKDAVILPTAQNDLARRLCSYTGANVEAITIPNVTHYNAMAEGRYKALDWMSHVTSNLAVDNQCGRYRS